MTARLILPLFEITLRFAWRRPSRADGARESLCRFCCVALSMRTDGGPIYRGHVHDTIVPIADAVIRWVIDALSMRDRVA